MIYRIIIIYLIIVLIYFKIHDIENNKLEKMLFSILIPFFGFVAVILSEVTTTSIEPEVKQNNKNSEIQKSKEFLTYIQSSLVDNLAIEDYDKAREIILSTKSLQLKEQCNICHIAINSKDTEISHIAAVSLMRIQNYFEKFLAHMELKTDLTKIDNLKKYIDGIDKYLDCKIAYGTLRNKYIETLISTIENLIQLNDTCEEKYYHILIKRCLEISKYEKAMEYSKVVIEKYGVNQKIYELILRISIRTKDKEGLYETLEKINSNADMRQELEPILEFWKGEVL